MLAGRLRSMVPAHGPVHRGQDLGRKVRCEGPDCAKAVGAVDSVVADPHADLAAADQRNANDISDCGVVPDNLEVAAAEPFLRKRKPRRLDLRPGRPGKRAQQKSSTGLVVPARHLERPPAFACGGERSELEKLVEERARPGLPDGPKGCGSRPRATGGARVPARRFGAQQGSVQPGRRVRPPERGISCGLSVEPEVRRAAHVPETAPRRAGRTRQQTPAASSGRSRRSPHRSGRRALAASPRHGSARPRRRSSRSPAPGGRSGALPRGCRSTPPGTARAPFAEPRPRTVAAR